MPRATLFGHALHPQLVGLPIGMVPFSFAMDMLYAGTGDPSYAKAAHWSMQGALASALAAGAVGALDYLAVPKHTEEKKLANLHAVLNLSVVGLLGLGLGMRERGIPKSKAAAVALGAISTGGLVVSQWFGGQLVYKHGVRVEGRNELASSRELKPRWDERAERALQQLADRAPSGGFQERAA